MDKIMEDPVQNSINSNDDTKTKNLKKYINKLSKGDCCIDFTEFDTKELIYETKNEEYYDILQGYKTYYWELTEWTKIYTFEVFLKYHFFFDVKFLFKNNIKEEDEKYLKIDIVSSNGNHISSINKKNKVIYENVIVYTLETGCIPTTTWGNSTKFQSNIKPYALFYKACNIKNKFKLDNFRSSSDLYFNMSRLSYNGYYGSIASACDYHTLKDGDEMFGEIIGPTNTSFDILIKYMKKHMKETHGYSGSSFNRLIGFRDDVRTICYVYDKDTRLYLDENYVVLKQLNFKKLHLSEDLIRKISAYF